MKNYGNYILLTRFFSNDVYFVLIISAEKWVKTMSSIAQQLLLATARWRLERAHCQLTALSFERSWCPANVI